MKLEIHNKKFILAMLALLGLVVSAELSYIYYMANFVPNAASSFCSINDIIDCDAVARTSYSLFLGVPQSVYGIFFYLFILFLTLFPFNKFSLFKNFKNPESYVFSLSTAAMLASIVLWGISTFIIHKVCLLCYILYGVNFFMLVFSKFDKSVITLYKESIDDFKAIISDKIWLILVCVFTVIGLSSVLVANATGIFVPQNNSEESAFVSQENTFGSQGNILGSENPTLIIEEFTDFQCPYCSFSNLMLNRLVYEVDNVQVIHHDFPLNKECNPMVKASPHKFACKAAYYARAAKIQGKYWDYIGLLFENQQDLSDQKFLDFGKTLNLDVDKLKIDANSQAVKDGLKEDIELAQREKINATPTYIMRKGIKTYRYEGLMPYPQLRDTVINNLNN
jgi:protein-disulfide isomerase/uncharacterized membrane protein